MREIENLLDEVGTAAEANPDVPVQSDTTVTRGHARSRTLQVRLNEDEYAAHAALADSRQLPVSTVVRSLLLPLLRPGTESASDVIERMRRELDLLSQQVS